MPRYKILNGVRLELTDAEETLETPKKQQLITMLLIEQ